MSRIEKLFEDLNSKMDSIHTLCADLIKFTGADKAFEDLKTVVGILRDPNGKIDKRTTGYIAARAEEMLDTLGKYELRFLVSCSTIDGMRTRVGLLRKDAPLYRKANDAVTMFDVIRSNPKMSVHVLREGYLSLNGLVVRAEAQSRKLNESEAAARVRDTFRNHSRRAIAA